MQCRRSVAAILSSPKNLKQIRLGGADCVLENERQSSIVGFGNGTVHTERTATLGATVQRRPCTRARCTDKSTCCTTGSHGACGVWWGAVGREPFLQFAQLTSAQCILHAWRHAPYGTHHKSEIEAGNARNTQQKRGFFFKFGMKKGGSTGHVQTQAVC